MSQLGSTARATLDARSGLVWALIELRRHEEAVAEPRGLLIVRAALAHRASTPVFLGLARILKGQVRHKEALQVLTDTGTTDLQARDTEETSLLHTLTTQSLLASND